MNYKTLNDFNKGRMKGTCNNTNIFEWEDDDLLDFLKGNLPRLYNPSKNQDISDLFLQLSKVYSSYNYFVTEPNAFLKDLKSVVEEIRNIEPYWMGINLMSVKETLNMHRSCLIYGEGGIGKSYFVKCLEEELESLGKKHLCVYGKFSKEVDAIDFDEIASIAEQEEFVFVFDAINEIRDKEQIKLAEKIKEKLVGLKGIRIIITYRSNTIDEAILNSYRKLALSEYRFAGVSFESALQYLESVPVADINEYADVLYSNNPFLLSKLPDIIQDTRNNNVTRFTHIYEDYIKKALDQPTWRNTKTVSAYLYKNNRKDFSATDISGLISDPLEYINSMEQKGFLVSYKYKDTEYFSFTIDSLADYLIVRSMFNELRGKTADECVDVIKSKMKNFHNINYETIIVMLFDKFANNYETIKDILVKTDLLFHFDLEVLQKIHFKPEEIPGFLKAFRYKNSKDFLIYFSGYINKPYNCTNFLNAYYLDNPERQRIELSNLLSGKYVFSNMIGRLKNILYFTCKCESSDERAFENLYTALWCCASCNRDVRKLAIKILYETIQHKPYLCDELINCYDKIYDEYIKEAIIYVLSVGSDNTVTSEFLSKIYTDNNYTSALGLARIAEFFGKPLSYINLDKIDLLTDSNSVSEDFISILHRVDLMDHNMLPFRFFGISNVNLRPKFLIADKKDIAEFNLRLEQDFGCIKSGYCNGNMTMEKSINEYYSTSYDSKVVDKMSYLASLEIVTKEIFMQYGLPFNFDEYLKLREDDFSSSIFRKCVSISIDTFIGSLMCNYYLSDFATYNNKWDSIGYEIYDPLEFGEEFNYCCPISIYNPQTEVMCDTVVSHINIPAIKDEVWWKDKDTSKDNLLRILEPIEHDGAKWQLVTGYIRLRDSRREYAWQDTYCILACTSADEKIEGCSEDRYLTIETESYMASLAKYAHCQKEPWLCKSIPNVDYSSGLFDETQLVMPPAEMASLLNLKLDVKEMCWKNSENEKIIICNNNKASYYEDPLISSIFIRLDAYKKLLACQKIKIFAFTEKFIKDRGFCDDSAFHYEIIDGKIIRQFPNRQEPTGPYEEEIPEVCKTCKYKKYDETGIEQAKKELEEILVEYGY